MLKHTIMYDDFNGVKQTETLHFNLTKVELVRLEISVKGGLADAMRALTEKENNEQELFEFFENLILTSYGRKSEDGKSFIKNDAERETFRCSAAYDALLMQFVTDADAAANFVIGILPAEMSEAAAGEMLKMKTANALNVSDTADPTTTELDPGDPPTV